MHVPLKKKEKEDACIFLITKILYVIENLKV